MGPPGRPFPRRRPQGRPRSDHIYRDINELRSELRPQPGPPPAPSRLRPSLWKFRVERRKKPSRLADIQEMAEASTTVPPGPSRSEASEGLSMYPPSDHGRAMDDPNTSMIAASASPEVQHVAAEPRRHQLEPRHLTVQSVPLPQELQTLQGMEWTKSDYSSPHVEGEGDGWQPGDLKDTPTLTPGTLTPPSPTETIMDVAAGVSDGLEINRDRQDRRQSNYLRIRQDSLRASVPSPNCYLQDTDDDVSVISNDEENDNFSERFFDADCEDDNGPRSLKTISKRSFSTWSIRSIRSTFSRDSGNINWVYD
ncbi:hypothetical protein BC826DRAFT_265468 [Russula brevipes]|nr:hypothetical protein BC826DRAFT_265468 [Russula brevipes]